MTLFDIYIHQTTVKNHLEPVPLVTGQTSSQESMSKEEILRRERMRESLNSITSFEYHQE